MAGKFAMSMTFHTSITGREPESRGLEPHHLLSRAQPLFIEGYQQAIHEFMKLIDHIVCVLSKV